jgi:hypothetical protein
MGETPATVSQATRAARKKSGRGSAGVVERSASEVAVVVMG